MLQRTGSTAHILAGQLPKRIVLLLLLELLLVLVLLVVRVGAWVV